MADVDDPRTALEDPQIASLFHLYVQKLASWYDLSDGQASFAKLVPLEALSNSLLFNAVIAFAAIYRSKTRAPSAAMIAGRFHDNCVKRLIDLDPKHPSYMTGHALAAVCLLRSYELIAEDSDPNRHLSGAYALATNNKVNMSESSLFKAGFFNYLREDITYSLMNRCPLKIDLGTITIPCTAESAVDDEDQLNIASLFLADAINVTFGDDQFKSSASDMHYVGWKSSLPTQFTPYYATEPFPTALTFPTVRMVRDCHVSVLQYCLVKESIKMLKESTDPNDIELNAIQMCGLAFTSGTAAVVVNSFGPMSFLCRYLQQPQLQAELVRRIQASRGEEDTGWPVQRMIAKLEKHWKSKNQQ
jgi:hypothetical protein